MQTTKKKTNPRKRPANHADVQKAKRKAAGIGTLNAMTLFFSVLCDKGGADKAEINRLWQETVSLSDAVSRGYVTFADLRETLRKEYDIFV